MVNVRLKNFWYKIRRLWCKHDSTVDIRIDVIRKYKNKRGYRFLNDVWENEYCTYCQKLLKREKIASDCNNIKVMQFLEDRYGL